MEESAQVETEAKTDKAFAIGAAVAGLLALLPYMSLLVFPSFVVGPLAAVWSLPADQKAFDAKTGAKLGFYSSLVGTVAATIVFDIIWQVFDYQLGQRQNGEFMLGLIGFFGSQKTVEVFRDALEQASTQSFAWYMVIFQMVANLLFAAGIGSLSGLISLRALGKRRLSR